MTAIPVATKYRVIADYYEHMPLKRIAEKYGLSSVQIVSGIVARLAESNRKRKS